MNYYIQKWIANNQVSGCCVQQSLAAMSIEPEGGDGDGIVEAGAERAVAHENPMYSAYMHMSPEEKKVRNTSNYLYPV